MIAIGTDIVEIERIRDSYTRLGARFVKRILTPFEQDKFDQRSQSITYLAKRFAAKEAVAKALSTGIGRGVSWQHIEISNNSETGAPECTLSGGAAEQLKRLGGTQVLVSLSDERCYAIAYVAII